jgi:CBS domain-containing protein
MKISEIMQPIVATATEKTSLKEAGRKIFSLGISAIPVVRKKKLVGVVTRKDILSKIFPSMTELAEDYIHLRDFDQMEKRLKQVLDVPVSKIMSKKIVTISVDTSIMNAQSIMLVNDFSHLPVVGKENKLLGMISQGDIFRKLIKEEVLQKKKRKRGKVSHSKK